MDRRATRANGGTDHADNRAIGGTIKAKAGNARAGSAKPGNVGANATANATAATRSAAKADANLYSLLASGFAEDRGACAIEVPRPGGKPLYYTWDDVER